MAHYKDTTTDEYYGFKANSNCIEVTVEEIKAEREAAKTPEEVQRELFNHFTSLVDATITAKIQAYNEANSVAFANADAFTKYAINTSSQHYAIANQFITWIDNLWATARQYQATATEVPTDEEFQAVLDAVIF